MHFDDYCPGTCFMILLASDFKSRERFKQYARFMKQDDDEQICVPIDSERAIKEMQRSWRQNKTQI